MTYMTSLSETAKQLNLEIVSVKPLDADTLEVIICHPDFGVALDLDTVSQAAHAFAKALDYEYALDVSTEGAEKELKETEYEKAIGQYVFAKLINPSQGMDHAQGELKAVSEATVTLSVRVKHTSKLVEIDRNNIELLRLAVKL